MSNQDISKNMMREAIIELGGDELAITSDVINLPVKAHNQDSRFYHNNHHRQEVAGQIDDRLAYRFGGEDMVTIANSLKCLIGTYHDIVQISVDSGMITDIMRVVNPYVIEYDGVYYIKEDLHRISSKRLWALLDVFDFEPGQELSLHQTSSNSGGMNEFLSAIVAMDELHRSGLPFKNIVRVIIGIAATIPFRGQKFFDNLVERLDSLHIGLTPGEIKLSAIISVETANCDVHDFREDDFLHFIQGTWMLLPEYSHGLRGPEFPVMAYRKALCGILYFLRDQVKPQQIFNHAFGYPTVAEVQDMASKAEKNIEMGVLYINAKLVSIGFLEAVSSLVAPTESLRGLVLGMKNIDYVLNKEFNSSSQMVYSTLIDREDELAFDKSHSPIAEFIFATLPESEVIELSGLVEKYYAQEDRYPRYTSFLNAVRHKIGNDNFQEIINVLAEVAGVVAPNSGRKDRILGISLILSSVDD